MLCSHRIQSAIHTETLFRHAIRKKLKDRFFLSKLTNKNNFCMFPWLWDILFMYIIKIIIFFSFALHILVTEMNFFYPFLLNNIYKTRPISLYDVTLSNWLKSTVTVKYLRCCCYVCIYALLIKKIKRLFPHSPLK